MAEHSVTTGVVIAFPRALKRGRKVTSGPAAALLRFPYEEAQAEACTRRLLHAPVPGRRDTESTSPRPFGRVDEMLDGAEAFAREMRTKPRTSFAHVTDDELQILFLYAQAFRNVVCEKGEHRVRNGDAEK